MKVDIITTTHRNAEKLKICLSSVLEKTKYVDFKWYLWANEPNDEMKNVIHEAMHVDDIQFTDRIIPIFNDNNNGSFSSNNNEAAKEGNSEYILLLNDDIEPLDDCWLLSMTNILDKDKNVGAVGSLLLYPDKKTIQHCGVMFDQRTNGLPYHIFYKQPISSFVAFNRYYQAVTGACLLTRRADFERLRGLSEDYLYAYEDIDYCLKLGKESKRSVYCAGSRLIHHEGISGKGKQHPNLKHNIAVFRNKWKNIFNDHQFYLQNPSFMVYK